MGAIVTKFSTFKRVISKRGKVDVIVSLHMIKQSTCYVGVMFKRRMKMAIMGFTT